MIFQIAVSTLITLVSILIATLVILKYINKSPTAVGPFRDPRIEGYWFDVPAKMALGNNATALSLIHVEYDEKLGYSADGTSHRVDGTQVAAWASEIAALKGSTLYYFYTAGTEAFVSGHELGAAMLTFARDGNSYTGLLQIFNDKPLFIQLQGQRIPKEIVQKCARSDDSVVLRIDHEQLAKELFNSLNDDKQFWVA